MMSVAFLAGLFALPSLVVFDLDWTLWTRPRFRVGPPWKPIEGGLSGVRAQSGEVIDLYSGSRRALATLADAGVPVAVASRTHRPQWAQEWLQMLHVDASRTVASVLGAEPLIVIRDGSKACHVREISKRAGVPLDSMLYFDDSYTDILTVEQLGVTVMHCPDSLGVTDAVFREGLLRHAKGGTERELASRPARKRGRRRRVDRLE